MQTQSAGRRSNRQRAEIGSLDQDVGRLGSHFGGFTAHDAPQRYRPRLVGDHAHAWLQHVSAMVDGRERFVWLRVADDDAATLESREIEGVQRLTAFHQHVVRDVDNVADHRDPQRLQAALHPRRTGGHLDAADHARNVTRAEFRALDLDPRQRRRRHRDFRGLRIRDVQRPLPQHGDLPRNTHVPQAIRAIAGDLQIDRQIVTDLLGRLVIQTGHGQSLSDLGRRHVQVQKILQPVP